MDTVKTDAIGQAFYAALNHDTFVVAWDDLPDNRRKRYETAAVLFVKSEALDAYLEQLRALIAA